MATINGIKLLHKRYSAAEWQTGLLIDGQTVVPTLDQGELGLNLTTLEVRVGTANNQTFSAAQPVGMKVQIAGEGTIITSAEVVTDEANGTVLKLTRGQISAEDVSNLDIPDISIVGNNTEGDYISSISASGHIITVSKAKLPEIVVTDSNLSVADGEIAVVTAIEKDGNHGIKSTKGAAATKAYVDSRKINVIDTGSGKFVTDVVTTENANGHDITITRADIEIDMPTATGAVTTNDNEATFVGSVNIETGADGNHTLTGTTKRLQVTEGKELSLDASNKVITLDIDLSQYAKKSDLTSAMEFKGTVGVGGTITELPTATSDMNGNTYKVVSDGVYAGKTATVGDVFICDGTAWRLVPSGADEYKGTVTAISAGKGLVTNQADNGAISESGVISHKGYVGANDVTPGGAKLISGIDTDEDGLGHVVGLTQAVLKGGSNVTVSQADGSNEIIINSSYVDTNTKTTLAAANSGVTVSKTSESAEAITYTVGHKAKEATAADSKNSGRTYVQSIELDDFGHIKAITTGTETVIDTDTNRAISVNGTSVFDAGNKTGIDIIEGGHIDITADATGKLTITDKISSATSEAEGLVKLGSDTIQTVVAEPVGTISGRTYAIQKDSSGKLVVNVPWTDNDTKYTEADIHSSHTGKTDSNFRFAVFKRDDYGHVVEAQDITTLDGNY